MASTGPVVIGVGLILCGQLVIINCDRDRTGDLTNGDIAESLSVKAFPDRVVVALEENADSFRITLDGDGFLAIRENEVPAIVETS